jgi:MFS family permease
MELNDDRSFEEDAEQPLIDQSHLNYLEEVARQNMLFRNFILMSVAFAVNQGCVVSCLAYASTELSEHLADFGNGFLCIAFSISALGLAKPIIEMVGPKYGLVFGLLGCCIYVLGFALAVLIPTGAWPVFIISSIIGGVAGGLLWTAQGKYFAVNSILYAEAVELTIEEINTKFAGIFAFIYLGFELGMTLIASGFYYGYHANANAVVFCLFSAVALLSSLLMLLVSGLDEFGTWEFDYDEFTYNAGGVVRLLKEDSRIALMVPYQFAYGFVSSFVPFYIFGTVISDSENLGEEYWGLLASVAVFGALVSVLPATIAAHKHGKHTMMVFGGKDLVLV